jgi:hypothetical protein
MICLYDLVDDLPHLIQNFAFAERVAKTKSLLRAEQILPLKRSNQHDWLHSSFAGLFVKVYDLGGEFELPFTSSLYNSKAGLPSNAYGLIRLLEAKGFLRPLGNKQWSIEPLFVNAVGPLTEVETPA